MLRAPFALALLSLAAGCGPPPDHTATLQRLRAAIDEPIASETIAEEHNQLVENVVNAGALDGLRQFEVQERIGRGEECGIRQICSERGFRPSDWFYDVGRDPNDPSVPAGPTLIVGFDRTGIVDRVFFVTRRHGQPATD
jgi:hypothetical protein